MHYLHFSNIPSHISKEILIIQLGLSSCDSGNMQDTIHKLQDQRIKVSVISFLGQVYLTQNIAKSTGGTFIIYYLYFSFIGICDVVLNEDHFIRLIMHYVQPSPIPTSDQKSLGYLVQMGFPIVEFNQSEFLCLW